jgi:hypothetical protein
MRTTTPEVNLALDGATPQAEDEDEAKFEEASTADEGADVDGSKHEFRP